MKYFDDNSVDELLKESTEQQIDESMSEIIEELEDENFLSVLEHNFDPEAIIESADINDDFELFMSEELTDESELSDDFDLNEAFDILTQGDGDFQGLPITEKNRIRFDRKAKIKQAKTKESVRICKKENPALYARYKKASELKAKLETVITKKYGARAKANVIKRIK